jgi:hypothetical protein
MLASVGGVHSSFRFFCAVVDIHRCCVFSEHNMLSLKALTQYKQLLTKQGRKCRVCKVNFLPKFVAGKRNRKRQAQLDHKHGTDMVRGILCFSCNVGLGCFTDSPALLRLMAEYIEEFEKRGTCVTETL